MRCSFCLNYLHQEEIEFLQIRESHLVDDFVNTFLAPTSNRTNGPELRSGKEHHSLAMPVFRGEEKNMLKWRSFEKMSLFLGKKNIHFTFFHVQNFVAGCSAHCCIFPPQLNEKNENLFFSSGNKPKPRLLSLLSI
jgi:hypothetical protein